MAEEPVTLKIDDERFNRVRAFLAALQRAGVDALARALNRIAFMWQAEIRRHAPVYKGLFRASIEVQLADPNQLLVQAVVGTDVPYAAYLEFGSEKLRGYMQQVARWTAGAPPVTRWYAKDGALANLLERRDRASDQAKAQQVAMMSLQAMKNPSAEKAAEISEKAEKALARYQRLSRAVQRGFDSNTEEYGPPFRASWDRIADPALRMCRDEVAKLMSQGKI